MIIVERIVVAGFVVKPMVAELIVETLDMYSIVVVGTFVIKPAIEELVTGERLAVGAAVLIESDVRK